MDSVPASRDVVATQSAAGRRKKASQRTNRGRLSGLTNAAFYLQVAELYADSFPLTSIYTMTCR